MNKCIKCYNYDKPSCLFNDLSDVDKLKTRTYLVDCWCDDMDDNMCSEYGCMNIEDEGELNGI